MIKTEKPINVEYFRSEGHRLQRRIFAREIHETWCADTKCKLYGKPAAQGVCHTRLGRVEQAYLDRIESSAQQLVDEMREIRKKSKMSANAYIRHLETVMYCHWMNSEFGLDELIRLRAQNAILKLKA